MVIVDLETREIVMATCPVCRKEIDAAMEGQLCASCQADVLAKDHYSRSDLRFVGFLAGVLIAAVASMPGAFVGYLIGRAFDQPVRGCTFGVIGFALFGLIAGFWIGPLVVQRMEQTRNEN